MIYVKGFQHLGLVKEPLYILSKTQDTLIYTVMPSYVNCCMYNFCYLYPSTVKPLTCYFTVSEITCNCMVSWSYCTWEIFGEGKNWWIWLIECHLPMQSTSFIYSCSYTCSLFVNMLLSNWFGLVNLPIFYSTKIFPTMVCPFNKTSFEFKASIGCIFLPLCIYIHSSNYWLDLHQFS